ncbi:MAG: PilZ domain-containing protein [Mucispirillum sp.]|nr:PilZ domain-containing protein [Mucispirillum sp.]
METITAVKKLIKSGLHLWVAVSGTQRLFFTKVSDVYDTSFTILPPTDNGENLIVTKKTELEFMFTIESGKYFFTTKPIGIIKENIALLAIELPASIQRNEMRAFYRIEMLRCIPVKLVHTATGFYQIDYQKNDIITMTCTDLSGGGMKLISPVPLDKDDELEIDLSGLIDGLEKVGAKVIRYIGMEEDRYAVGIMFTSLTEFDRDKIVRCVFQRQHNKEKLSNNFRRSNVF